MNRTKTYIFIVLGIVIIVPLIIYFYPNNKNIVEVPKVEKSQISITDSVKKDTDSTAIFKDFVKDFNSHQEKNINKYINTDLGMIMYYHDGPYPIITALKEIGYEIDWLNADLFENVKFESFPEYLGDFKFSKTGFFVQKNQNNFLLKNFDNSYTSHPPSFFNKYKKLEKLCNFWAIGISKNQKKQFYFYFRLDQKKLTLLGLEVDRLNDVLFANSEASFIPFKNKNDIENYLRNRQLFLDKEQNATIDLAKKEIVYYDFPADNPFIFDHYEIGEIEENFSKIKSAEIIFYPNESKEDGFITYFSNKGRFVVYPMGVRPPYFYDVVKK